VPARVARVVGGLGENISRDGSLGSGPLDARPLHWIVSAHERRGLGAPSLEESAMTWEVPDFVEVKMDAEINSYQDDFDREQDDRF
jgi:hypothetical protein